MSRTYSRGVSRPGLYGGSAGRMPGPEPRWNSASQQRSRTSSPRSSRGDNDGERQEGREEGGRARGVGEGLRGGGLVRSAVRRVGQGGGRGSRVPRSALRGW